MRREKSGGIFFSFSHFDFSGTSNGQNDVKIKRKMTKRKHNTRSVTRREKIET